MLQISLYKNAGDNIGAEVPLMSVINAIKNGYWKDKVEYLRSLSKEEYDIQKKKAIPAATFQGTFSPSRGAENLKKYNKLFIVDIDDISVSKIPELREMLSSDPYVLCHFISPSNMGVKILMRIDNEAEHHRAAYDQIERYFIDFYKLPICITGSGKDVPRLCFVSYDPDLYFNKDAKIVNIDTAAGSRKSALKERKFSHQVSSDIKYIFDVCVRFTERKFSYVVGQRNTYIHNLSCTLNRCGVSQGDTVGLIDSNYITPDDKWHQSVRSAYEGNKGQHNTVTIFEFASSYGIDVPKKIIDISETQESGLAVEYTMELSRRGVKHDIIKEIVTAYWYDITERVKSRDSDMEIRRLINKGFERANADKAINKKTNVVRAEDDIIGVYNQMAGTEFLTSGTNKCDLAFSGGLIPGNVYGYVGCEETYKTFLAIDSAIKNAKNGIRSLFFNMEMSKMQFMNRVIQHETGINLFEGVQKGVITKSMIPEIHEKIEKVFNGNLLIIHESGLDDQTIIDTILDTKAQICYVDGIGSMSWGKLEEIGAVIKNSFSLKEIAKTTNAAMVVIMHTVTGVLKHLRDPHMKVRGGMKVRGNFDGFISTSLFIDEEASDMEKGTYKYKRGMLNAQVWDKRGMGGITDVVLMLDENTVVVETGMPLEEMETKF
jgi:KaiC/GvpD/RAD55 family RecA-like ATPase